MDSLSAHQRSQNMRAIKSKDNLPELCVRSQVHGLGFRYRLHRRDLPGRPDIVLGKLRTVILVHGCFWHCHTCADGHVPKSRRDYWPNKLAGNLRRDRRNVRRLRSMGWRVLIIWECQTRDIERLRRRLLDFLKRARAAKASAVHAAR